MPNNEKARKAQGQKNKRPPVEAISDIEIRQNVFSKFNDSVRSSNNKPKYDDKDREAMIVFATTFNELLAQKKVDQDALAAGTGIGGGSISAYRHGTNQPGLFNLVKIAEYLCVDCHHLMTGVEARHSDIKKVTGLSPKAIENLIISDEGKTYTRGWSSQPVSESDKLIENVSVISVEPKSEMVESPEDSIPSPLDFFINAVFNDSPSSDMISELHNLYRAYENIDNAAEKRINLHLSPQENAELKAWEEQGKRLGVRPVELIDIEDYVELHADKVGRLVAQRITDYIMELYRETELYKERRDINGKSQQNDGD